MPHFCNECCDITFLCLCCRANLSFLWVPQGRSRTKVEKLASLSSDKAARMQASAGCGCESQAEMLFKRLREWGGCGWDLSVASVYQCGNRECCEQVQPLCHGVVPACLPGQDLSTVVVEGGPARRAGDTEAPSMLERAFMGQLSLLPSPPARQMLCHLCCHTAGPSHSG